MECWMFVAFSVDSYLNIKVEEGPWACVSE